MQQRPTRYEIRRPLEFRLKSPAGPALGKGRTVNISRRGLLFQSEVEMGVGSKIEIVVHMGPAFGNQPPVNLHVQGVTVRSQRGRVAVSIKKYRLKPAPGSPSEVAAEDIA